MALSPTRPAAGRSPADAARLADHRYLGALFILLLNAFWTKDAFTGQVEPLSWTLAAFQEIFSNDVYRTVAIRTIGIAIAVTITDALLALPIAYYMARMASPRTAASSSSRS